MEADDLRERVRESNRQAADAWDRWSTHRRQVTDLLCGAVGDGRLCILGAGHLHDLDLARLGRRYAGATLVDLDAPTVRAAVERRGDHRTDLVVVAPVDLSGVIDELPLAAADHRRAGALLDGLARHHCDIPGQPFAVTASLGVLTQLLQTVVDAGLAADDAIRVALAVRDKHLRDLVRLTKAGGTCVLVTDVVSTTTAPSLLEVPADNLEPHMARLVAERNFFTGTNPYRIAALLEEQALFRAAVTSVRLVGPWLWAVTPDRMHLTCAIVARRRRRRA
jgi:hypothetical protein